MAKDKPITNPDTTCTDKKYWERVLASHGLPAEGGRSPRTWVGRGTEIEQLVRRELYIGGSNEIEGLEEELLRGETGEVRPLGRGPGED